ncbi:hypothetical protein [Nocardioides sp. MH1]|uniref:hypothetical protein n=1 Tax=Nocardioides sp. MH1 TaxID=3242490 RepID=UPI0035203B01
MTQGGGLERRRVLRRRTGMRNISVAFLILTALLAGCSHEDDGGDKVEDSLVDRTSASDTAVAFISEIAKYDYEAARAYVAKASLTAFEYLADASASLPAAPDRNDSRADDLSAGDEQVKGHDATVVILGRLCRPAGDGEQCVNNSDPASTNPIFLVHLTRQDDTWYVYFPRPDGHSVGG